MLLLNDFCYSLLIDCKYGKLLYSSAEHRQLSSHKYETVVADLTNCIVPQM